MDCRYTSAAILDKSFESASLSPKSSSSSTAKLTLLSADWLITVDENDSVIRNGAILISDQEIVATGTKDELLAQHPRVEHQQLAGHILAPGLVNAHGHAAMTLLRGFADDLPLMDWLENHIWPTEQAYVDYDFVEDGVRLAVAEMIRGGTSCFSDMYFFPNATASVSHNAGIRAHIAFPIFELGTAWASSSAECIDKGLQVRDDFKHSDFIDFCFGPHAPYTVQRPTLEHIAMLSNELDAGVHIHVQETASELADFVKANGQSPLAMLNEIGLCSPRLQCAHLVHLAEGDLDILSDSGTHAVHCIRSNLKLASGFSPIADMLDAGVNVALGTDGAASNNSLDMLSEMQYAALTAKAVAGRADAVSAPKALRMATMGGAKALGLDDKIGSIEAGKQADIMAVCVDELPHLPLFEPVSHLAYSASRADVRELWVAGRQLLKQGELTTLNSAAIADKTRYWQEKLQK